MKEKSSEGKVYFVGSGPGDPDLLTLKGYKILRGADVVIYTGSLLNPRILDMAENAKKIDSFGMSVEEVVDAIVDAVGKGKIVVRLHDGDPSIFGSINEQFELLREKGIDFEVIPGVSSFLAAAARLKTELTVPELTQTVVITRFPGKTPVPENITEIAKHKPTMIFFLSASLLDKIVKSLYEVGYPPEHPCAICYKVSWDDEKIITGTLEDIVKKAKEEGITSHALFIVSKAFGARGKRSFIYSESYVKMVKGVKSKSENAKENKNKIQKKEVVLSSIFRRGIALVSITKGGASILRRIKENVDFAKTTIFLPEKFKGQIRFDAEDNDGDGVLWFSSLKDTLRDIFSSYDGLIAVISLGALIRLISPYMRSKDEDPAVLCIDEAGRFVISVLSGHVGGANELALKIASIIDAKPVITTASDSLGTIPVDIFGREFGWKVEADHDTIVKVSAAVVNHEPVALIQESGERNFFKFPENIAVLDFQAFLDRQSEFSACLFITHRIVDKPIIPTVFYRPRVLHVGIGFDAGVTAEDILNFIDEVFEKFSISKSSIKRFATIDKKREDREFERFAKMAYEIFSADVIFLKKDEIDAVSARVKNPSDYAKKYIGVISVSEACALVSAGENSELIVEKQKGRAIPKTSEDKGAGITIAIAIEKFE